MKKMNRKHVKHKLYNKKDPLFEKQKNTNFLNSKFIPSNFRTIFFFFYTTILNVINNKVKKTIHA